MARKIKEQAAAARALSINAETQAEETCLSAAEQLHKIHNELFLVAERIKAVQPVSSGSICLELYGCGKKCMGCPHARWVRYRWNAKGVLQAVNLTAAGSDPVLALSRNTPHFKEAKALIREAKTILSRRARLLAAFSQLSRIIAGQRQSPSTPSQEGPL